MITIPSSNNSYRVELLCDHVYAVTFSVDTHKVRDSISNEKLERLHLLTRKDLLNIESACSLNNDACRQAKKSKGSSNIERAFSLNNDDCRKANDANGIDGWVTSMKDSCVRFYKPQNSISELYPSLKYDDFMLIIMNENQCEILKKFGTDCICIDITNGLNPYGFEVVTLMVIDDLRQGFPCAFLICNRTDQEAISIFYENIKMYTGSLKPDVFMSDMADSFYNSWITVMDLPARRLYCSWLVDCAWRKHLNKVQTKEKQIEVYHTLRTLLQETDSPTFEIMLDQAIKALIGDSCTQEFGKYFEKNFSRNPTSWGYCYQMHAGLSNNMHLERMHKTIEHIFLQGRNVKRLDKCIHILMKFIKDRLSDRLIMLQEGKITSKIQTLRKRHMAGLQLESDKIIIEHENGWQIYSTANPREVYSIQENMVGCTCNIVCDDCNTCIHRYMCTCDDNSIKWNMCKHIHLLCMKGGRTQQEISPGIPTSPSLYDEEIELQIIPTTEDDYQEQFLTEHEQLMEGKQEILNELKMLIDYVDSVEELDIVKKCTAPIKASIDELRISKEHVVNFQSTPVSPVQVCDIVNLPIYQF